MHADRARHADGSGSVDGIAAWRQADRRTVLHLAHRHLLLPSAAAVPVSIVPPSAPFTVNTQAAGAVSRARWVGSKERVTAAGPIRRRGSENVVCGQPLRHSKLLSSQPLAPVPDIYSQTRDNHEKTCDRPHH